MKNSRNWTTMFWKWTKDWKNSSNQSRMATLHEMSIPAAQKSKSLSGTVFENLLIFKIFLKNFPKNLVKATLPINQLKKCRHEVRVPKNDRQPQLVERYRRKMSQLYWANYPKKSIIYKSFQKDKLALWQKLCNQVTDKTGIYGPYRPEPTVWSSLTINNLLFTGTI